MGWGGCVAHVILVSAKVPIGPFDLGLLWVWEIWNGIGSRGTGIGTRA